MKKGHTVVQPSDIIWLGDKDLNLDSRSQSLSFRVNGYSTIMLDNGKITGLLNRGMDVMHGDITLIAV